MMAAQQDKAPGMQTEGPAPKPAPEAPVRASDDGRDPTREVGTRRGQPGLRQCAVTRARLPKEALIRLVVDPDGQVVVDLLDRAPGRGYT